MTHTYNKISHYLPRSSDPYGQINHCGTPQSNLDNAIDNLIQPQQHPKKRSHYGALN